MTPLRQAMRVAVGTAASTAARWRAVVLALGGIFCLDWFTPRGLAVGTLYALAVLLVPPSSSGRQLARVALTAAFLSALGHWISPPVDPWWVGAFNRGLTYVLVGGVTLLVWKRMLAFRREGQAHARWQSTVEAIADAVVITDSAGTITFLNAVAEQLTGWPQTEAQGRTPTELMPLAHADTHLAVQNPLVDALVGARVVGLANHTVLWGRDGSPVPIEYNAAPIRTSEGEIIGAVMVFRDVTKRYTSEAKLAQSVVESAARAQEAEEAQQLLRALMTFIPEGITVADAPDARIRMISQHGLKLLGRDEAALRGSAETHPEAWDILTLDHRRPRPEELPLTRSVTSGEVVEDERWLLRHVAGTEMIVSCNAGPIRDSDGHIVGGLIAWRDITKQHLTEQEVRRHDRMKDTLVAMIGHELRQPLSALLAAAQLIRYRLTGVTDEALRPLDILDRQVRHLTHLVDDLQDTINLTQGRFRLDPAPMDLGVLAREVVEAMASEAEVRHVRLIFAGPEQGVWLSADAARLRQVMMNLLQNAIRHSRAEGTVTCALATTAERVTLRVQDGGSGIAADLLPHLFDAFVQGPANAGMAGLGLAIAKGIVNLHGGTIVSGGCKTDSCGGRKSDSRQRA